MTLWQCFCSNSYAKPFMGREFFLGRGRRASRRVLSSFWIGVFVSQFLAWPFSEARAAATNGAAVVLTVEGTVELNRSGAGTWQTAATNAALAFGDSLRTGPQSRATVKLSDLSVLRVSEKTVLVFREQEQRGGSLLDLKAGASYFFNRSKPASVQFRTPLISGAIRGTEFNLSAEEV